MTAPPGEVRGAASRVAVVLAVVVLAALAQPPRVDAGAFVFAGEGALDRVTHPSNYTGTGGEVVVSVCIDPADPNRFAMETPVKNIVAALNAFAPVSPNLVFGAGNNIPSGGLDFESLTLHEFGHCLGLAHPNLATESGLTGARRDATKAEDGTNGMLDADAGTDLKFGSSDDVRGDDVNRHWFEPGVNNPFLLPAKVDVSTYDRTGALPAGHLFVANAGRDVGPLLGFPATEAVMQQGQFSDEDQRRLQHDDVATLMYAMTGLDETAGTGDDYTIKLVYAGFTTACDISVEPVTTGFASCSFGGTFPDIINHPTHLSITTGTFRYNTMRTDWFFNPVLACLDIALDWPHNQLLGHSVCGEIRLQEGFLVGAKGDVTLEADTVVFEGDTRVAGELTVINN